MTRARLCAVLLTVLLTPAALLVAPVSALADPPAPPGTPTAVTSAGNPTVGPIFRDGLTADHGCTGSVVAGPTRDLVLTAAHCITGTAAGYLFVPGYDSGRTPYGVWTVVRAYVDPSWVRRQDPGHDYAILVVAKHRSVGVQDVVGANLLGLAPRPGSSITDVAYNAGIGDRPITCTVPTYRTDGYPSFNCHGYVGCSSGSPWLSRIPGTRIGVVHGVIGGLHQGGCYDYTSYTSAFTTDVYRLLARATFRLRPDVVPEAGSDGC